MIIQIKIQSDYTFRTETIQCTEKGNVEEHLATLKLLAESHDVDTELF